MKFAIFLYLMLPTMTLLAQEYRLDVLRASTDSHFRGLSVVDNTVAWVSGSKGTVGRTTDGAVTWRFQRLRPFETLEFRSLYAFDSLTAIVANAGSPGYVLKTTDGGRNWTTVYSNSHAEIFIDGIDFWNGREGVIYGDALDGRMLLLRTFDGGSTWEELPSEKRPALNAGEGSFAASGTGIRCVEEKTILIATGGITSRLWVSNDKGKQWHFVSPPIIQGEAMTGIFSIAFLDDRRGIIVGGNYEKDTVRTNHVFYTHNAGRTWSAPTMPTRGMRECVEYIGKADAVACGKQGIDLSRDGGSSWQKLSDEKQFSVVRRARRGSLIILAGAQGRIAILSRDSRR